MSKYDHIRPLYDSEVNEALRNIVYHPMMKALMSFTFPDVEDEVWIEQLKRTHSKRDFQANFIYNAIHQVLKRSSEGFTTSGFEKLDKHTPYLYISNHRDIIMDTSLLNVALLDHGLIMTASAIGDNLVKKSFLRTLSRLNRSFIVQRSLSPRELLQSSKLMSEFIYHMLTRENRSVWIAQREGRTKDGNDATQQGVLKMLAMAADGTPLMEYFKNMKIVPVSISYEYDPTDALKMPQLLAKANDEVYVKEKNEDFTTLISGIMGQKKRIHLHVGDVLDTELDAIAANNDSANKQLQALGQAIDDSILNSYRLWPTNYIAYDLLNNTTQFADKYTEKEKQVFERRLEMRIDIENKILRDGFLAMYANPVVNKMKYHNA
ncbi:1-acyl-sn-glycerol-3-phosphate acyltransferase [Flavobacterium sp. Sd200]|uniref:1-acyl-sn-glycerol-3-phosphate acyltransferase n=1 Tax=Flavobacterium sp. Sd200 TaxID=2692211 RepID=UPI0013692A7F|nr:1-acyl-sn-glycerol-3-phosphate acyltransferase [Flavobacterium sp. Sd200]MXN91507.1 1-acyl-sn-glycerol-3-phosphate acyltransferase [Flavobacterium sp. Sd200]